MSRRIYKFLDDVTRRKVTCHRVLEHKDYNIILNPFPTTTGATIVSPSAPVKGNIFSLDREKYMDLLMAARECSLYLERQLGVSRCALLSDSLGGDTVSVKVLPMHGLSAEWQEMVSEELEFSPTYSGYISTKDGPKASAAALDSVWQKVRAVTGLHDENFSFDGEPTNDNLFARLIRGEIEQWRVWEDSRHVAFLTPFPNTPGFTVVAPRKHLSSNIPSLSEPEYRGIMAASYDVVQSLREALQMDFVGLACEGLAVDYAHVKLIPLHGVSTDVSEVLGDFFHDYRGYVTSKDGPEAKESDLLSILCKIRGGSSPF